MHKQETVAQFIARVLPCTGSCDHFGVCENCIEADLVRVGASIQSKQEPAWQPIETAPKDGTRILVVCELGVIESNIAQSGSFIYKHLSGSGSPVEPTHWMPLPKPPVDGPLASIKEKE